MRFRIQVSELQRIGHASQSMSVPEIRLRRDMQRAGTAQSATAAGDMNAPITIMSVAKFSRFDQSIRRC